MHLKEKKKDLPSIYLRSCQGEDDESDESWISSARTRVQPCASANLCHSSQQTQAPLIYLLHLGSPQVFSFGSSTFPNRSSSAMLHVTGASSAADAPEWRAVASAAEQTV